MSTTLLCASAGFLARRAGCRNKRVPPARFRRRRCISYRTPAPVAPLGEQPVIDRCEALKLLAVAPRALTVVLIHECALPRRAEGAADGTATGPIPARSNYPTNKVTGRNRQDRKSVVGRFARAPAPESGCRTDEPAPSCAMNRGQARPGSFPTCLGGSAREVRNHMEFSGCGPRCTRRSGCRRGCATAPRHPSPGWSSRCTAGSAARTGR